MMNAARTDGVGQSLADVLLADQIGEILWTPLSGENQIGHCLSVRLMVNTVTGDLPAQVTARHSRGTRLRSLPLLPSGSDGVHGRPLRGTRLSLLTANTIKTRSQVEMT